MKNHNKARPASAIALTVQALEDLKKGGFRFVRVNAYTRDKRLDYVEPYYIVLVPIKELSEDLDKKGIYEPVDSPMLVSWAKAPDDGIEVFIVK